MKSSFLHRSFRFLAVVPAYISLPTLPCLLLASTSSLAATATPTASTQPASAHSVSSGRKHAVVTPRRKNTAPHMGSTEQLEVTRSHTHRYLSSPGTVNVMSGQELRALRIESPKDIAAFTPGVTAVNATSGSTPIFSIRGVGLDDYIGTNMGELAFIWMGCWHRIRYSIMAKCSIQKMLRWKKGRKALIWGVALQVERSIFSL